MNAETYGVPHPRSSSEGSRRYFASVRPRDSGSGADLLGGTEGRWQRVENCGVEFEKSESHSTCAACSFLMNTPHLSIDELLRDRAWIVQIARALVRDNDAADEVVQDVWVSTLKRPPHRLESARGLENARGRGNARAWFARVARNRVRDRHRSSMRRKRREAIAAARPHEPEPTPDELVDRARLQGMVARAVAELGEPYRRTILLRYFRNQSVVDIAALEDVPQATVRTRLRRGHAQLRSRLTSWTGGNELSWRAGLAPIAGATCTATRGGSIIGTATSVALGGSVMATLTTHAWILVGAFLAGLLGGVIGVSIVGSPQNDNPGDSAHPMLSAGRGGQDSEASNENPSLVVAPPPSGSSSLREDVELLRSQVEKLIAAEKRERMSQEQIEKAYKLSLRLLQERAQTNERTAIATSRNAISAQAQLQISAKVDMDNDGTGEYGGFLELAGAVKGRMRAPMMPPVLSRSFRRLTEHGEVLRSGYYYRVFLAGSNGQGIGEPREGFSDQSGLDPDLTETTWCMYAWPEEYGVTGTRTFVTNQGGDVLSTDDRRYSGSGKGPPADAAFESSGIVGNLAHGKTANDGNEWVRRG